MGFNQTAVKTAVKEFESGGAGRPEPPDRGRLQLNHAASESFERRSRQPRAAVLCGSYRRGVPSLVRAYETLSAAGVRVLSPSGRAFEAEMDGFLLNEDAVGILPEPIERLRLDGIRAADLVWLHAPGGYVGPSGALEVGFAHATGVPVYAEEMPSDFALRSFVSISPLDQVIAETRAGGQDDPCASPLPPQEFHAAVVRGPADGHRSAEDIMRLITEEIGQLARRNPGQRQQRPTTARASAASP